MNLLVLGQYGETTSGPSRVLTEVVDHLSENLNILVLSPRKRREQHRADQNSGNLKIRFQACGQIPGVPGSHQLVEFLRINRALNKLDFTPDLVWTHSGTLFASYRFSKFRKVPSVSTVHGVFGGFYKIEAKQALGGPISALFEVQNTQVQKYEFSKAHLLTTYSEYLQKLILEVSPKAKVIVIPNGVNTKRFAESRAPRKHVVMYVGRMAKIKGVHILIESMRYVAEKHPDWSLQLVGGAFDQPRSFFEGYMNEFTKERIEFLGQIPNEELSSVLNDAGIFVMPTLRDGFEIAMMEALASGIPCVTTAAFERTELYGGYAETVPPNDSKALGEKLVWMIENYSSLISPEAQRRRVDRASEFDWSSISRQYENLFRKLTE
ncbi:MAG: glycosyltransferase family 4 protein [Candidatus Thorarchaeota archaeon]